MKKNTIKQEDILVTGHYGSALGSNDYVIANGKCNHPTKRFINEQYMKDGLPIPKFAWTHCIFCAKGGACYFGGDCEYRIDSDK